MYIDYAELAFRILYLLEVLWDNVLAIPRHYRLLASSPLLACLLEIYIISIVTRRRKLFTITSNKNKKLRKVTYLEHIVLLASEKCLNCMGV